MQNNQKCSCCCTPVHSHVLSANFQKLGNQLCYFYYHHHHWLLMLLYFWCCYLEVLCSTIQFACPCFFLVHKMIWFIIVVCETLYWFYVLSLVVDVSARKTHTRHIHCSREQCPNRRHIARVPLRHTSHLLIQRLDILSGGESNP